MTAPALAEDPCKAPLPAKGAAFSGSVSYVVDGDGLCVGADRGGIEVRLGDFNAPDLEKPEGKKAKAALERIAMGKTVECVADRQSRDRTYAICTLDGKRLGDLMREAGVAEGGE
jgi:endonuclease YncB( thermonuclease family)